MAAVVRHSKASDIASNSGFEHDSKCHKLQGGGREAHIYRYDVEMTDGSHRLFHSIKDITSTCGVPRYFVQSMVKGLGREGSAVGRRRCRGVRYIRSVHVDADGQPVPVIGRRPWQRFGGMKVGS